MFRLLADATVVAHFGFVLYVVFGGLLVFRWPRSAWVHLPAAAWGAWIEFAGWVCPLTYLENWLRAEGGGAMYTEGFVERYLVPIVYPPALTRPMQWLLGAIVLVVNVGVYVAVWRRGRGAGRAPGALCVLAATAVLTGCQPAAPQGYPEPPEALYTAMTYQVATGEATVAVAGAAVDRGFFEAARLKPLLGRAFADADYAPDASPTAMLSHQFWTERFAASPEIIGRTLDVDGRPAVIVGILPSGYTFPGQAMIWMPRR